MKFGLCEKHDMGVEVPVVQREARQSEWYKILSSSVQVELSLPNDLVQDSLNEALGGIRFIDAPESHQND